MSTYAIIEVAGSQFRVGKNTAFDANRLDAKVGKSMKIKHVLMYSDGKKTEVGTPYVKDVEVTCEIIKHLRAKKVIAFKYKRRKGMKKMIGHRQDQTRLKVTEIKIGK